MVGSQTLFIIPTEHALQWVSAEARNIGKVGWHSKRLMLARFVWTALGR